MYNLEAGFTATIDCRHFANVARSPLHRVILYRDIAHFEDADRQTLLAVLTQRFQQAR